MFMLTVENILMNSTKSNWRFKIKFKKFHIETFKQFVKSLKNHNQIFALMCAKVDERSRKQKIKITKMLEQLKNLKSQFDDIKTNILSKFDKSDHVIDLKKSEKLSFMSLYNLSQNKLAKLRRYIENVLIKKWIKHSIFLANASIFFVSKRDEDFRLCVNYRELNAMTIKNRHSLSLITKTLNRLNDVKKFIKVDLKNAYHKIRIKQNDEWKTTFRTWYEYFEYQIMFFELINVSTIFQIYINETLRELVDIICVIYLNDILIYSNDSTQHWRNMRLVFERLKQYELYINLKKCEFIIDQIEFLNFIVFIENVQINSKKIRIIEKWSRSTSYRKLQMFLNFVNYYRRFIHNYSKLIASLIDLLKDNKQNKKFESFIWEKESKLTFRRLRDIFTSIFIFHHFDSIKKIKVKIDVSSFEIANILNQFDEQNHWRSMTFWSRKMISTKINYEIHDQKLLIIITMFQQWRHYFENVAHAMKMWSNHNNLRDFMKQKKFNSKQIKWILKLAIYDFEIFHRANKINSIDESSRRSDYEEASSFNIKLLSTLQNKLALSSRERIDFENQSSASDIAANIQLFEKNSAHAKSKREVLEDLDSLFQLVEVQIVISRKEIRDLSEKLYEKSQKSMKFLIKKFQTIDKIVMKFVEKSKKSSRRRRNKSHWKLNFENFLKFKNRLYVFKDAIIKKKLISKNHDDFLIKHFDVDKTVNLI